MAQLNYPALYVGRELVFPTGDAQVVKDYLARVKQYGGKADPQSHITQYGYLQGKIIAAVLQKCGANCDAAKFNQTIGTMHSVDTEGFSFGPLTYSKQSTVGVDTARFYTWDQAKQQAVLLPGSYNHSSV